MLKSFQWQWIKEQGYIEILETWEKNVSWNINVENIVCATNEMKNVQWVEESDKIRKKYGKNELWLKKQVTTQDRKIELTKMNNCKKKISEIVTRQQK
jgi:hypothetical protein